MGTSNILENAQLVPIIEPVDLTAGANSGDWVSLKNHRRCLFILTKGAGGTAGQDPTVVIQEATSAAGAGAVDLVKIDTVYQKQAATNLAAVAQFTVVEQTASASWTDAALAEQAGLIGIEIRDTDLSSGFTFVTVNIADPGATNAQLGAVIALLYEPRYGVKASSMPSAIA